MYPPSIQKLIAQFSKFPTIGPRTAARFVFYLLKIPNEEIKELTDSLLQLRTTIKFCSFCFNTFEPLNNEEKLCEICQDKRRDQSVICVIEKESDLNTIEKTKQYHGRYFVLGGTVSKLKKEDLENLRTLQLIERINRPEIVEIILATNSTLEGENTALYLERKLENYRKKITKLARGLPIGGELEYADPETLKSAIEDRK